MTSMPQVAKIEGSAIRMSTLMGNPCHVVSTIYSDPLGCASMNYFPPIYIFIRLFFFPVLCHISFIFEALQDRFILKTVLPALASSALIINIVLWSFFIIFVRQWNLLSLQFIDHDVQYKQIKNNISNQCAPSILFHC